MCKPDAPDLQRSQSKLELSVQKQHKDTSSSFASTESDLGKQISVKCVSSALKWVLEVNLLINDTEDIQSSHQ